MKVKCINNTGVDGLLTKGKEYEVISENEEYYHVANDRRDNSNSAFWKHRFKVTNKIKENWDKFINDKLIVNCDTEEKAIKFVDECYKRKIEWYHALKSFTAWRFHKENTCYNCCGKVLTYSRKEYFEKEGYKVIQFEDMFVKEEEKMSFEIGEHVVVANIGQVYSTYKEMFDKLSKNKTGLAPWENGFKFEDGNGEIAKVTAIDKGKYSREIALIEIKCDGLSRSLIIGVEGLAHLSECKFTLKEVKEKDLIVHCDTKEKAINFVKKYAKDNDILIKCWENHKENTCYHYDKYCNYFIYDEKEFYEKEGYTIISFDNLLEEETSKIIKGKRILIEQLNDMIGKKVFITINKEITNLFGMKIIIADEFGTIGKDNIFWDTITVKFEDGKMYSFDEESNDEVITMYEAVEQVEENILEKDFKGLQPNTLYKFVDRRLKPVETVEDNTDTGEPVPKKRMTPEQKINNLEKKLSRETDRAEEYWKEILRFKKEIDYLTKANKRKAEEIEKLERNLKYTNQQSDYWKNRFFETIEIQKKAEEKINGLKEVNKLQECVTNYWKQLYILAMEKLKK